MLLWTPGEEITAAKPAVYAYLGILGNLKVPAPFRMEQDSCENFNSPCPLAANTDYTYTTTVFVQPGYPSVCSLVSIQLPVRCLRITVVQPLQGVMP